MKVIGIIPSRYESTRFPGKPLIDLAGKTMIQRVYEGVSRTQLIDRIIVATDDQRIFSEVESFGGEVMMTSTQHKTGTDRCIEIVNEVDQCDIVINIQGDEPLVNANQIDQMVDAFSDSTVQIATLANSNISRDEIENLNRIKLVLDQNDNALYFSRSAIPNTSKGDPSDIYMKHIGLYAFRKEALKRIETMMPCGLEQAESLEQLRWMFYGEKIKVIKTTIETPNIDVPEDVEKVLSLLR
jgi:3-deoxy-manno-octulosonate cytidylyltransferase (CMP-KDO synthetase)